MGLVCGCCVSLFGCLCGQCSKVSPTTGYSTRLPYLFFLLISGVVALLLKYYAGDSLIDFFSYSVKICSEELCAGNQAVLRISFALALFFVTLLCVTPCFPSFHHQWWAIKFIYYAGLVVACFYIPNDVFSVYGNIARVFGGVFLLIQIILFIDFAYRWNESWVEKGTKLYLGGLLAASLLLIMGSIVFWVLGFLWYAQSPSDSCEMENFFVAFTIVLCVIFTVLSISEWVEHGALLPSAILTAYCTYLLYTALKSNPSACNRFYTPGGSDDPPQIILGVVLLMCSISYSSWSISRNRNNLFGGATNQADAATVAINDTGAMAKAQEEESEILDPEVVKNNLYFHFIMLLALMYMGMLLSDWASQTDDSESLIGAGKATMWVNMAAQWTASALYIWTLVAPKLLSNRDFS